MESLTQTFDIRPSVRCAVIAVDTNSDLVDGRPSNVRKVLLARRSPTSRHNPELWEIPGGQQERDPSTHLPIETNFETAARELQQEVALTLLGMTEPQVVEAHSIGEPGSPICLTLAGVALAYEGTPKVNDAESTALGWFTLGEVHAMGDSITHASRLAIETLVAPLLQ